jgi:hypothetical protein
MTQGRFFLVFAVRKRIGYADRMRLGGFGVLPMFVLGGKVDGRDDENDLGRAYEVERRLGILSVRVSAWYHS